MQCRFREDPSILLCPVGNRKLLAAEWRRAETGREAKFYRLTRSGRTHLEAGAASWQRLSEAMGVILGMAEEGAR